MVTVELTQPINGQTGEPANLNNHGYILNVKIRIWVQKWSSDIQNTQNVEGLCRSFTS
jgi:hypothetical protein